MRALIIGLAAGAAAAASVSAQTRLPAAVQAYVGALNKDCRGYGGKPGPSPDLVKSADLNGDGLADYLVNVGAYACEGAASAMGAGQSGADVAIFTGGPGGTAALAYEDTVYEAEIETKAGRSQVLMSVAGLRCGQKNAADLPFAAWAFCKRPLAWNPGTRKFAYGPLSQARPIQ